MGEINENGGKKGGMKRAGVGTGTVGKWKEGRKEGKKRTGVGLGKRVKGGKEGRKEARKQGRRL
jgi:hypothetical protein